MRLVLTLEGDLQFGSGLSKRKYDQEDCEMEAVYNAAAKAEATP